MLMFPEWDSSLGRLLLWNFSIGSILGVNGWLPACFNCELMTLVFVMADGFVVGLFGYSFVAFLGQVVVFRNRTEDRQIEVAS